MRDANRIGPVLQALAMTWQSQPDLRLGQLVMNAYMAAGGVGDDPYFIEDDRLLIGIQLLQAPNHSQTGEPQ